MTSCCGLGKGPLKTHKLKAQSTHRSSLGGGGTSRGVAHREGVQPQESGPEGDCGTLGLPFSLWLPCSPTTMSFLLRVMGQGAVWLGLESPKP